MCKPLSGNIQPIPVMHKYGIRKVISISCLFHWYIETEREREIERVSLYVTLINICYKFFLSIESYNLKSLTLFHVENIYILQQCYDITHLLLSNATDSCTIRYVVDVI